MKLLCILLLACVAHMGMAGKSRKCVGKKMGAMTQFNGRGVEVMVPCKYPAILRQACGKYRITLTPGNIWMGSNYYLNTLWLYVNDTETGKAWDGRTTNRVVVKYYMSKGKRPMFNKGNEELFDPSIFKTEIVKNKPIAMIRDKKDTFRVTFAAWDPYNRKKYPHPSWEFECNDENMVPNEYPSQTCGGDNLKVEEHSKAFDVQKNHMHVQIYFDIFSSKVVQTDPECIDATSILEDCGDDQKKIEVLKNCGEILSKKQHAECATYYQCTPMEAFNSCLRWGCSERKSFDPQAKDLCYEVGEALFLCGNVSGAGSLTDRVRGASCYKDYLEINALTNLQQAK